MIGFKEQNEGFSIDVLIVHVAIFYTYLFTIRFSHKAKKGP